MRLNWDEAAVLPDRSCAWVVELVGGAVAVDLSLVDGCGSVGLWEVDELPSDCTWVGWSIGPFDVGASG